MKKKKNRLLSFCFSLLPGCAEMYMGFMKTGISLLVVFWGTIAAAAILNIGEIMFITLIVWFYGFFHGNNLASLSQEELNLQEDNYLFGLDDIKEKSSALSHRYRKIISYVLIFLGVVLCIRSCFSMFSQFLPEIFINIYDIVGYYTPQFIVGVGIIAIGVTMIKGKKQELLEEDNYGREKDI